MGPVNIFLSYASEDEKFLQELEKHLNILRRSDLITKWHSQPLQPDMNRRQEIDEHLESAAIILPLISYNFLKSNYSYKHAMKRALERHDASEASLIPILLNPVNLEETPFKELPVLPDGGKAVTEWQDHDEAFVNIIEGIRKAITTLRIFSLIKEKQPTNIQNEQTKSRVFVAFKGPVETEGSDYEVGEIAAVLQRRKQLNHGTVLVLGARAGGLFRSTYFYEILRLFSQRATNNLLRIEQFGEYHSVLTKYFNKMDIHSIIQTSLQEVSVTKADRYLAELLKQGHFDEIITTNIDDMLEQSLLQVRIKKYSDYEVLIPAMMKDNQIQTERSHPFRIIKLFGDFASRTYSIERDGPTSITNNPTVKSFLQSILARDILVVGLDPIWDWELLRVIPTGGRAIWLVGEDISSEYSTITDFPQDRSIVYVEGRNGSYEHFMTKLYTLLSKNTSLNSRTHDDMLQGIRDMDDMLQGILALEKDVQALRDRISKVRDTINNNILNIQSDQSSPS